MDTPSTPQQPSSNSKMALRVALVVIIIIALGAAVYFMNKNNANSNNANSNTNTAVNQNTNIAGNTNIVSNTNSAANTNTMVDTSGWKTYENTKFRYSFRYPSDWLPLDNPNGSMPTPDDSSAGFGGSIPVHMEFRVQVEIPSNDECNSIITCMEKFPFYESSSKTVPITTSIDKQEAYYQEVDRGWVYRVWYLYSNSNFIKIYTIAKDTESTQANPFFNAIISTIDFK